MTSPDDKAARRPRGRPPLVDDRRQQIIEASFQEIAAKGLEGFRIREVAAAAGIDHSTIRHYFATKQHLLTAVVDFATRPMWGTTPREGAPMQRIRSHIRSQAKLLRERPALPLVLREFDLLAGRDRAIAQLIASREAGWRGALTAVFELGRAQGDFAADLVVENVVELMIATVKGASLSPAAAPRALAELERLLAPATREHRHDARQHHA